jgi:hypothetical protein
MQFSAAMLYDKSIDVVDAEEVESPTSNSIRDRDLYSFHNKKTDYDNKVCMLAWPIAACFTFVGNEVSFSSSILSIFSKHH